MAKRATAIADQRVPLSKERVLGTAMKLADEGGIEALSMRKLAHELGVEAMSLYYYFSSKDDLLTELVDMVTGEIEPTASGSGRKSDWKADVRRSSTSYHAALRRHPWSQRLTSPERVRPTQLRYMEALLRRLREAGFSPNMTHHAYHILESHVVGSTLWAAGIAAVTKGNLPQLAQDVISRLPIEQFPYMHEHIEQHMTKATKGDKSPFDFGLDLILDGLDRLRDKRRA